MGQNNKKKEIRNRLTLMKGDVVIGYDNVEDFKFSSSAAGHIVFFTVEKDTECWCDTASMRPFTPPVGTRITEAVKYFHKSEFPVGYTE